MQALILLPVRLPTWARPKMSILLRPAAAAAWSCSISAALAPAGRNHCALSICSGNSSLAPLPGALQTQIFQF